MTEHFNNFLKESFGCNYRYFSWWVLRLSDNCLIFVKI